MIVFLAIIGAIIAIAILGAFMNRFYRKSTRDVALVRNHFSAQALKGTEVVPTEIENFQIWQKKSGQWLLVGRQAFRI